MNFEQDTFEVCLSKYLDKDLGITDFDQVSSKWIENKFDSIWRTNQQANREQAIEDVETRFKLVYKQLNNKKRKCVGIDARFDAALEEIQDENSRYNRRLNKMCVKLDRIVHKYQIGTSKLHENRVDQEKHAGDDMDVMDEEDVVLEKQYDESQNELIFKRVHGSKGQERVKFNEEECFKDITGTMILPWTKTIAKFFQEKGISQDPGEHIVLDTAPNRCACVGCDKFRPGSWLHLLSTSWSVKMNHGAVMREKFSQVILKMGSTFDATLNQKFCKRSFKEARQVRKILERVFEEDYNFCNNMNIFSVIFPIFRFEMSRRLLEHNLIPPVDPRQEGPTRLMLENIAQHMPEKKGEFRDYINMLKKKEFSPSFEDGEIDPICWSELFERKKGPKLNFQNMMLFRNVVALFEARCSSPSYENLLLLLRLKGKL